MSATQYLSQEVNYLGFLNKQLRDLGGIDSLVFELLQNADDVRTDDDKPGASRIEFDVRDDCLIVSNDGVFREVDFQRMRSIASGGKRAEANTTGAFGIGFVSVYQVTDRPQIYASGRHWTFRPDAKADQRIAIEPCGTEGTRFVLPWAFDGTSTVRERLSLAPVDSTQVGAYPDRIYGKLWEASLFLRQIDTLTVRRNGALVHKITRQRRMNSVEVVVDGAKETWWYLKTSFMAQADKLRDQHSHRIESKRGCQVLIALRDHCLDAGHLYATLPSESGLGLPFHINADFYPSSDRKHVILGQDDYQTRWNCAAIVAASQCLAENLMFLRDNLGHTELWRLLSRLKDVAIASTKGRQPAVAGQFWEQCKGRVQDLELVYTTKEQWCRPGSARWLNASQHDGTTEAVLSKLDIPIVHGDLRSFRNLITSNEVGTPMLAVRDVSGALQDLGVKDGTVAAYAPPILQLKTWRRVLWAALDVMINDRSATYRDSDKQRDLKLIAKMPIGLGVDGKLHYPRRLFRGSDLERDLFPKAPWIVPMCDKNTVPGCLAKQWTASDAVDMLAETNRNLLDAQWNRQRGRLVKLYAWFLRNLEDLIKASSSVRRLRRTPIWPSGDKLMPLEGLYLASGFDDPLGTANLLDSSAMGRNVRLAEELGVAHLTFSVYVKDRLPRALKECSDYAPESMRTLVRVLAIHLGEIQGDKQLRRSLANLPLIMRTDGSFGTAIGTYLDSPAVRLLDDGHIIADNWYAGSEAIGTLYGWLGVQDRPRGSDIVRIVRKLVRQPLSEVRTKLSAIAAYLTREWALLPPSEKRGFVALKDLAWLPAQGDPKRLWRPKDLCSSAEQHLYATQGRFWDLGDSYGSAEHGGFATYLGLRTRPTTKMVVRHLLACSGASRTVDPRVYDYLQAHTGSQELDPLKNSACLALENTQYVRPDHAFFAPHGLGQYRTHLGASWEPYHALCQSLGVRDVPEPHDYASVLVEIAREKASSKVTLELVGLNIVRHCWQSLGRHMLGESLPKEMIALLASDRKIPDETGCIRHPRDIVINDRPLLGEEFAKELGSCLVKPLEGAWHAMVVVGATRLSQACTELVDAQAAELDTTIRSRVMGRKSLMRRILDGEGIPESGRLLERLSDLDFKRAKTLRVRHVLEVHGRAVRSPVRQPSATMVGTQIIAAYRREQVPWRGIARELIDYLCQDQARPAMVSVFTDVLNAARTTQAGRILDELGYARLADELIVDTPDEEAAEVVGQQVAAEHSVPSSGEPKLSSDEATPSSQQTNADLGVTPILMRDDKAPRRNGTRAKSADAVGRVKEAVWDRTKPQDATAPDSGAAEPSTGDAKSASREIKRLSSREDSDLFARPNDSAERMRGLACDSQSRSSKAKATPDRLGSLPRSRADSSSNATRSRSEGRLITYVEAGKAPGSGDPERTRPQGETERAAVRVALEYEMRAGRHATEMARNNKGYDLVSKGLDGRRYIEVKGLRREWSASNPARLTQGEYHMAYDKGTSYWLYVVEFATSDEPRLHRIQNPAAKVNQYAFDDGWQLLAEADLTEGSQAVAEPSRVSTPAD